ASAAPARNENYREQLQRIARAMACAQADAVVGDLEAGCDPQLVELFVAGNVEKRFEKLDKGLEFIREALPERFDDLARRYMAERPLGAYDSGQFDGEKFLVWLSQNHALSPVERDYVACQRARHAVENLARTQRRAHVRFQELHSLAETLAGELPTNDRLSIHLNPIRVWATFCTGELIGEPIDAPVDVLVFAVRTDTSTALLEEHGRQLVEELARLAPCTLSTWSAVSEHADRDELRQLCVDLADMGLVAFS
ncbi:MAG: hypothetical protein KDA41_07475, partial [Planctomycetales bacterium]|nr:hypothetical protein [Planctomycetales bacterium]